MLVILDIVWSSLMESLMIVVEKPKLALMKARLLVWSLVASLKHRNKNKTTPVVQDMEVGYDAVTPSVNTATAPAMAEYEINHAFVCEHAMDEDTTDCQSSSVKTRTSPEPVTTEDSTHQGVTPVRESVVERIVDCESISDTNTSASFKGELDNETSACESSAKQSTDNNNGTHSESDAGLDPRPASNSERVSLPMENDVEVGNDVEEHEGGCSAKRSLILDLSAIEQDAANDDNVEPEDDNRSKDLNNNRLEVDTAFCYYDNDAGYEPDSIFSSSDEDNTSDDDDDFFRDSDDAMNDVRAGRPIIIAPIERQLPVSEGLRVTVLKREARKTLPDYFTYSAYSRRY